MSDQVDFRELRRKKLETLYGQYLSLLTYEGTLVSARFGHAIATQTIFFAAYFVVTTSTRLDQNLQYIIQAAIAACAVASLVVYALILARTSVAATAWRQSMVLIEEDEDFWYPAQRDEFPDLDIVGSRSRQAQGTETRQLKALHAITSTKFKIILFMGARVRDPIDFYAIYFPTFFFLVWASLFVVSSHRAIATTPSTSESNKIPAGLGRGPGEMGPASTQAVNGKK